MGCNGVDRTAEEPSSQIDWKWGVLESLGIPPLPVVESGLFISATGHLLGSGVGAPPQWPVAQPPPKIRGAKFKTLSVGGGQRRGVLRVPLLACSFNFIALPGTSFGASTWHSHCLPCW